MKRIKKSILLLVALVLFAGCGYTTRGFLNPNYKTVYVKPVVNNVKFTGETQENNTFRSVPPLIENKLTNALFDRFNLDGNLKTVDELGADLVLDCVITDYLREAVRFDDDENVEEHRIKIWYNFTLTDSQGAVIDEKSLIADEEYALTGSNARSEDSALVDLLDDAARRVVEEIIESW